jgi:predicted transcriptional regulator of viral defense system
MHDQPATKRDRRLAQLAARQHNLITTRQLRRLGFTKQQILERVRNARLHRIHRGVYAVGTPNLTRKGWYLAAVLACGNGAVLSHNSAASLRRIQDAPLSPVHVTVPPGNGSRTRKGIKVHRANTIEFTTTSGIRTTTPARTLMDLSHTIEQRDFERALDEAHHLTLLHQPSLRRLFATHPRRSARLRRALPNAGTTRTKSQNEEAFVAWLDRYGVPRPTAMNVVVADVEVDAYYDHHRLIVEIDPWHTHERKTADDKKRDRRHLAAGLATFRIPDDQLTAETAGELRRSLASRAGVSSSTDAKKPPTSSIRWSMDSAR